MQARRVNLCRWDVKAVCEQRQGGEEATVQTITPPSPATEAGIRNPESGNMPNFLSNQAVAPIKWALVATILIVKVGLKLLGPKN